MKYMFLKGLDIMANDLSNRFNQLFDDSDRFFGNFGRSFFSGLSDSFKDMKSDIKENDDSYQVIVDLPGVEKKNIALDFKDNVLTVSAKRDSFSDESDAEGNLITSERSYGSFSRQYTFANVEESKVSASYQKGVLTVTLPKKAEAISNTHHIAID